jgi:hypothetical protein
LPTRPPKDQGGQGSLIALGLRSLIEKTPDAELLREKIGFAAERLMELEVTRLTGAACGKKSPERLVQPMATLTPTATEKTRAGRGGAVSALGQPR